MNFELLQNHLAHPRHAGDLPEANAYAEEVNPVCGDQIRLMLCVSEDKVARVGWLAYGCPPTLACASILAEMIYGNSVIAAKKITRQQIVDALGGLPSRKQHAAALAWETLQSALAAVA